jgi:hypothetical protein
MDDTREAEQELFENLADDALSLLRTDFVLIGLYLTTFGLFSQIAGQQALLDVLFATYTQWGISALFASMATSVLVYRKSRRITVQQRVRQNEIMSEERQTINIVTASAFASFGSVVCISLGILEAFAGQRPPFSFPLLVIGLSVILWILAPFSLLAIMDKLSEKSKTFRDIVQLFL